MDKTEIIYVDSGTRPILNSIQNLRERVLHQHIHRVRYIVLVRALKILEESALPMYPHTKVCG
jgi:hypothetical protein